MTTVILFKCDICEGCKPRERVLGIITSDPIKICDPDEVKKHICFKCIMQLKKCNDILTS